MMEESRIAYTAGIIDGEGTIGILERKPSAFNNLKSPSVQPYLTVMMSDPTIPHLLQDWWGGSFGGPYKNSGINSKPLFKWSVTSRMALDVCETIFPYLQLKTSQAQLVIDFYHDTRLSFTWSGGKGGPSIPLLEQEIRNEYATKIKTLNKRGI